MSKILNDLLDNPNHFLFHFDNEQACFVEMNRTLFNRSIFLDSRIKTLSQQVSPMRLGQLIDHIERREKTRPSISYIFHMAHVGSTLLARGLDIPGKNLVYREPQILRHLGVMAASKEQTTNFDHDWNSLLRLVTHMLSNSYGADQGVIVKANVPVNFVAGQLMDLRPDSPAIVLYSRLDNYLLSLMKTKDHQEWVYRIIEELSAGWEDVCGISTKERTSLSLPQAIACIWLSQISIFQGLLQNYPQARSLDSETLFCHPAPTLEAAFKLIGQAFSGDELKSILNGQAFNRHSKNPGLVYNNQLRIVERDKVRSSLVQELSEAQAWVKQHADRLDVTDRLSPGLVAGHPSMLGL